MAQPSQEPSQRKAKHALRSSKSEAGLARTLLLLFPTFRCAQGYAWRGHPKSHRSERRSGAGAADPNPIQDSPVHYVYIIQSESDPAHRYVGYTADLNHRLETHNAGKSPHTAKYIPWALIFYSAFPNKQRALDFERYLKSHSGKAFAHKRLIG